MNWKFGQRGVAIIIEYEEQAEAILQERNPSVNEALVSHLYFSFFHIKPLKVLKFSKLERDMSPLTLYIWDFSSKNSMFSKSYERRPLN